MFIFLKLIFAVFGPRS